MFLSERFHYSRSFAGMRVADDSAPHTAPVGARCRSGSRRSSSPASPAAWCAGAGTSGWYVHAFPLVVLFSVTWSLGELVGYLSGPGDSLLKVR